MRERYLPNDIVINTIPNSRNIFISANQPKMQQYNPLYIHYIIYIHIYIYIYNNIVIYIYIYIYIIGHKKWLIANKKTFSLYALYSPYSLRMN